MTRKITLLVLTSAIAASLQFSVTASADNHEIADRVRPAGILVINEATATAETAAPQADIPGGEVAAAAPVVTEAPAATEAPATTEAPAEATADAGKSIYDKTCFACHLTGVANAPLLGNKEMWAPRIALGADALYASVINGKGAMPPKGGAMQLSDDDVKTAVDYMVSQAQ